MTLKSIREAFVMAILFLSAISSRGEEPRELSEGILKWSGDSLERKLESGETSAQFEFTMRNVSTDPIVIRKINPSCGCTTITGTKLPLTLKPREQATIPIVMDVTGKSGTLTKTLLVVTDRGDKTLFVTSQITPLPEDMERRKINQGMAKANRQTVLQGSCAVCHVEPAESKLGMELFHTACSICHEAEHRAEFVPDLTPLRGDKHDATYWLTHIREGRKGTLMPAFDIANGGFLSDAQVESLVKFLLEPPPTKH